MNSMIYVGQVVHIRRHPVEHKFNYKLYYYSFDLDELGNLDSDIFLFSYNKKNVVAIHDKDYLTSENFSIKEKIKLILEKNNLESDKIFLVTAAKYFNYVFNPVSFFYCYLNGKINAIVVEINNTFGERHLYILDSAYQELAKYKLTKDFHVSPFFTLDYEYEFKFLKFDSELYIEINMIKNGNEIFHSRLEGVGSVMNSKNIIKTIVKYPLHASLTMPRILFQAIKLHFVKKLPAYFKPYAKSERTIKVAEPTLFQNFAIKIISNILSNIKIGQVEFDLPNRTKLNFGDFSSSFKVKVRVEHFDFFKRLLLNGDIALGESYSDGLFYTDNLTKFIKLLIFNRNEIESKLARYNYLSMFFNFLRHLLNVNTIKGAKKNIAAHYDLSNSFFKLVLDSTMTYSSAIFENRGEDLKTAQIRKINTIIKKLRLTKDDRVLEIGCGWGSLAINLVKATGCHVTCLTLSKEQAKYFQEKIDEENLNDRIKIIIKDYREFKGKFDKVVSVEMIEAIGSSNYNNYFKAIDDFLNPNGIAVIQAITYPDNKFEELKSKCDWIQKYIFPGSLIPSLTAISNSLSKTNLLIDHIENIADSYAETLRQWNQNLIDNQEEVLKLNFDDYFIRTFKYYFSYCEAAFATRTLNTLQIVLMRQVNEVVLKESKNIIGEIYE